MTTNGYEFRVANPYNMFMGRSIVMSCWSYDESIQIQCGFIRTNDDYFPEVEEEIFDFRGGNGSPMTIDMAVAKAAQIIHCITDNVRFMEFIHGDFK